MKNKANYSERLKLIRTRLRLPVDRFEIREGFPFDVEIYFKNQKLGKVSTSIFDEIYNEGIVGLSGLDWNPVYRFYKKDISLCLPEFDFQVNIFPNRWKSIIIRDLAGNRLGSYYFDYDGTHWFLKLKEQ